MTMLIGLSGYAQSGKDSAAGALVEDGWERRAFADSLRDFLYALNPIVLPAGTRLRSFVNAYGWETAKTSCGEVRELLQRCGTEAGRQVIGQNVWVNATLRDLGDRPVVVTDVRFENEAHRIQDLGGIVVRVERPGVQPPRMTDGTVHPSETALDLYPFDHVLYNTGTLDDLRAEVRNLVSCRFGLAGVCK